MTISQLFLAPRKLASELYTQTNIHSIKLPPAEIKVKVIIIIIVIINSNADNSCEKKRKIQSHLLLCEFVCFPVRTQLFNAFHNGI